jgi:hypothetical protein
LIFLIDITGSLLIIIGECRSSGGRGAGPAPIQESGVRRKKKEERRIKYCFSQ